MSKLFKLFSVLACTALLVACGGGGSNTPSSPTMTGVTVSYGTTAFVINTNAMRAPTIVGAPAGTKTFAVSAGTLPAGLTLNTATGELSGTPTALGSTSFTITLTITGATGSSVNSITVAVANPPITGTLSYASSAALTRLTLSNINPTVSGLPNTATYAATNLPAGMSIAPATGMISGTPTSAGTFDITVTASDANFSGSVVAHATGTIANPAIGTVTLTFNYPTTTSVTRNSSTVTTITPTISGVPNGATATYALATGVTLPTGFTLNTATGVISGTTTVSPANSPFSYNVNVSVSGYTGAANSGASSITVVNPANYLEWTAVSSNSGIAAPTSDPYYIGARMAVIGSDLYVVMTRTAGTEVWKSSNSAQTWTKINTDASLLFLDYTITVVGNNLVLNGGYTNASPPVFNTTARLLDVTTATATSAWSIGASAPFVLAEHAIVKQGSSYYITGGWTGAAYSNAVYTSTDAQSWTAVAVTSPFGVRSQHCSFSDGSNLYVFGGQKLPLSTGAVPNPQTDLLKSTDLGVTWSTVASAPHPSGNLHPTCAYLNGRMVIAFGGIATNSLFNTASSFAANVHSSVDNGLTWSLGPNTPSVIGIDPFVSHKAAYAVLNGALYQTMASSRFSIYGSVWKLAP